MLHGAAHLPNSNPNPNPNPTKDALAYFAIMEARLRKFNYRLHWAKGVAISDGAYLSKQYKAGTWPALEMLRKELDPTSKFTNEHMVRWFGS